MGSSQTDRLGGLAEDANHLGREQVAKQADQLCGKTAAQNTEGNTFFGSVILLCAKVLSDEGGQCLSEAVYGQEGETFQLGVCAAAGHGGLAETVDVGLNHHIGKGNHAELDAGGQTVANDLQKTTAVNADLSDTDTVGRIDAQKMDEAQNGTDTLRNGGGNGGGADTELQNRYEQHIQQDIYAGGENEIVQGMLTVTHCVEDTDGWQLDAAVADALAGKAYLAVKKPTFGSTDLPFLLHSIAREEDFDVTLIGLCTDICVVSNALLLKAHFPEHTIAVDAACCAGVTPDTHAAALKTMAMCQIETL